MNEVLVFMANGTEEIEALTVVDLLRRVDIPVKTVSVNDEEFITGSHNIMIKVDEKISDIDPDKAAMIVLPGGMPGTNKLMDSEKLTALIHSFNDQGKYVAAICAAPSILGVNGILEGKNATSYPGFEEKLLGANVLKDKVVVDGNIITSRGLGTAIEFSAAIITALKGEDVAKDVLAKVIYE